MIIQNIYVSIVLLFVYFMIISFLVRKKMIRLFVGDKIKKKNVKALKRTIFLGARFDAKIIAIILMPVLIIIGGVTFLNAEIASFIMYVYVFFMSVLYFGLIIGNIFYFKTYNHYYDIFIFGLIEDDTCAVLKNIYDDYPVLKLLGVLFLLCSGGEYIVYVSFKTPVLFDSVLLNVVLYMFYLLVLFFLARGTIKKQPLGKVHAQVSFLSVINKMVPNGVTAFFWALSERKLQISFEPVDINKGKKLISNLFSNNSLYAYTKTNLFLEKNQPNVVFVLMESFSYNILRFDNDKTNDLLGRLRTYFEKDIVFNKFISVENGTAPTLASIYFHSPIQNISQSLAQNTALKETPFFVYKNKGYKVVFITSGNLMWRNLANYLPLQGVDDIYGENEIIDIFPEAKKTQSYWGVGDEYAFKLAQKLLEKSNVPLFINILTMTNHPPYKIPDGYQAKNLDINAIKNYFGNSDKERLNMLGAFQYSANALGEFIMNVDNDEYLKHKTIISASGDHHTRGVKMDYPKDLFVAHSVPFLLHIPKKIKEQINLCFDENKIGSHKDIMPTLYNASLSCAKYWHLGGNNLLSLSENIFPFSVNDSIWCDCDGVVDIRTTPYIKYKWSTFCKDVSNETIVMSKKEIETINSYKELLFWQINYQVKGYK